MILGLDYWQTLSANKEKLLELADCVIKAGGEVHVITAVGKQRGDKVRDDINELLGDYRIPIDVHVVIFDHPREAPELKLAKCLELGVDIMIDDRRDITTLLKKNDIVGLNIMRKDNRTYDYNLYPEKGIR